MKVLNIARSFATFSLVVFSMRSPAHEYGPEAARAALTNFTVAKDLEVTLFASEPMLRNPTDMDIDERGRVWITEGVNYRSTFKPWGTLQPAGDRIVILEDTNGSGFANKETVFYQGPEINAALGICVLGNKVIVSCSPNVYVFTDTKGAGKADKKEILFSGIGGVDHDHGVHAFSFGPDGKLYFNFGNESKQLMDKNGKPIKDPTGNEVNDSGHPYRDAMAFRCNLDGSEVEVLGHNFRNPYELAVDSFGTVWQSDNDDDGNRSVRVNYVMSFGNFGFQDELTGASWRSSRINLEAETPRRHWHQNDPGVVPNLMITGSGAPTGLLVYEGNLLPESFHGGLILGDAGRCVVRAISTVPQGAGYSGQSIDLLSSKDMWFRPSDVCTAPDGSIYVADWNDAVVGGHDMVDRDAKTMTGRIYRVAPPGVKPFVPKLDLATAAGCVRALQSPNLSTRYLAWTALQAMPRKGEAELLKLWKSKADPRLRARALFLLTQHKDSAAKYVKLALREKNADLRITGLRAAQEAKLEVIPFVKMLLHDPSPQVRRECALALRHNTSPDAPKLRTALAQQHDGKDRWYLEALGIGADGQVDKFFDAWLTAVGDEWNTPAGRDIIWRMRSAKTAPLLEKIIAAAPASSEANLRYYRAFDYISGPEKTTALIDLMAANPGKDGQNAALISLVDGLKGLDVSTNAALKSALTKALESARGTPDFARLVEDFQIPGQEAELLKIAIKFPKDEFGVEAARLVVESPDTNLLASALRQKGSATNLLLALRNTHDRKVASQLMPLIGDTTYDLAIRRQIVSTLSNIKEGATQLLQFTEAGTLPKELKFVATLELNQAPWPELKAKAAQLLPLPQTRTAQPLPPLHTLLISSGNHVHGAQVFARQEVGCINCHRVNDKGADVGPALSEIGAKLGREALYEAILDPSAGIAAGYEAWRIELKGGDEAYGIIVSETADELIIKDAKAVPIHLKKADIISRQKSPLSLMPSGLEQTMSTQDLVDLVSYLASLKKAQ